MNVSFGVLFVMEIFWPVSWCTLRSKYLHQIWLWPSIQTGSRLTVARKNYFSGEVAFNLWFIYQSILLWWIINESMSELLTSSTFVCTSKLAFLSAKMIKIHYGRWFKRTKRTTKEKVKDIKLVEMNAVISVRHSISLSRFINSRESSCDTHYQLK